MPPYVFTVNKERFRCQLLIVKSQADATPNLNTVQQKLAAAISQWDTKGQIRFDIQSANAAGLPNYASNDTLLGGATVTIIDDDNAFSANFANGDYLNEQVQVPTSQYHNDNILIGQDGNFGVIPVFLVAVDPSHNNTNHSGLTYYGGSWNACVMVNYTFGNGNPNILAHELGHVFAGVHPPGLSSDDVATTINNMWEGDPKTILQPQNTNNDAPYNTYYNILNARVAGPMTMCTSSNPCVLEAEAATGDIAHDDNPQNMSIMAVRVWNRLQDDDPRIASNQQNETPQIWNANYTDKADNFLRVRVELAGNGDFPLAQHNLKVRIYAFPNGSGTSSNQQAALCAEWDYVDPAQLNADMEKPAPIGSDASKKIWYSNADNAIYFGSLWEGTAQSPKVPNSKHICVLGIVESLSQQSLMVVNGVTPDQLERPVAHQYANQDPNWTWVNQGNLDVLMMQANMMLRAPAHIGAIIDLDDNQLLLLARTTSSSLDIQSATVSLHTPGNSRMLHSISFDNETHIQPDIQLNQGEFATVVTGYQLPDTLEVGDTHSIEFTPAIGDLQIPSYTQTITVVEPEIYLAGLFDTALGAVAGYSEKIQSTTAEEMVELIRTEAQTHPSDPDEVASWLNDNMKQFRTFLNDLDQNLPEFDSGTRHQFNELVENSGESPGGDLLMFQNAMNALASVIWNITTGNEEA